jgi:hypothetical protein
LEQLRRDMPVHNLSAVYLYYDEFDINHVDVVKLE